MIKQPRVYLEEPLEFSHLVGLPKGQGTGTADCVIVYEDELIVLDYKNGEGVRVDVKDNAQLLTYALAAAHKFSNESEDDDAL
jgi:ATP-dependent exoDNAse (exonuclease V) beta subunit